MKKATKAQLRVQRYVLIGVMLGVYFGWFFRPVREPSLWTPIILSAAVTVVMTVLRTVRGEREGLGRYALTLFVRVALGIAVLELRHPVFDWGGRVAVVAMTALLGGVFGYWMSRGDVGES